MTKEMLEEDILCMIEDLAWWIKENLDDTPLIFRNDQRQEELYKQVKEFRND